MEDLKIFLGDNLQPRYVLMTGNRTHDPCAHEAHTLTTWQHFPGLTLILYCLQKKR